MLPVFQKVIDQVTAECGSAGGAFIVVRNGETIIKETFGVADIETGRPITTKSIFDIASDTKCMTTSVISQLCDEGLLSWDDPVRKYYPEFFLCNEAISEMMTLKDLASHRSGICSQNVVRFAEPQDLGTRAEYVARLKYLTMSKPFRDQMQYQNEYYMLLGHIAELVTGKTYEDLVRERIANRVGMQMNFRGFPIPEDWDIAEPHSCVGDHVEKRRRNRIWQNNPCGGAQTNLDSMEKWLKVWVNGGELPDGSRIVSEAMYKKMTTPVALWRESNLDTTEDQCRCYALGFAPSIYRGRKLVYHGGSIIGFRSAMGFFPKQKSGYMIMINSTCQPLAVLKILLCDAALGILKDDYSDRAAAFVRDFKKPSVFASRELPFLPISSEEKAKFVGKYYNGLYKDLTLADGEDGTLRIQYQDVDKPIHFCGIQPNGEYLFQEYLPTFGNFMTDLRFSPDGKHMKLSMSEYYTPNPFEKVE